MLFKENHSSLQQKCNWTHTSRDRPLVAVELLRGNSWISRDALVHDIG